MRLIDADAIPYTMVCKENWLAGTGMEKQCAWKDDIDAMPTIEERKTGKWIKEDSYKDRWGDTINILRCPICEFKHDYTCGDTFKHDDGWFSFCPNCGADMRTAKCGTEIDLCVMDEVGGGA